MNRGPLDADSYRERVQGIPALNEFCGTVAATLAERPDGIWALEPGFRSLLSSGFVTELVADELRKVAADAAHVPAGGGSEADLALVVDPVFVLSLRLLRPEQNYSDKLYSASQHGLLGVIAVPGAEAGVPVSLFEQPDPEPYDEVDRDKVLRPRGTRVIQPLDVMRVRPGTTCSPSSLSPHRSS
ncbi:hypothetical protein [Nocardioides plantarum]|uniref:hypothetical protein n=1 Tax=Nocardioides plantarum TaxID=29299 RepID=UPI00360924FC